MKGTGSNQSARNPIFPRVTFLKGSGDLPLLEITTAWSKAEIYLHGAHVTHFGRRGEPPLLFLSQRSRFETGQPIRGGIPVIFPWFGKREDLGGQHGFARHQPWELMEIAAAPDGAVAVRLRLPDCPDAPGCRPCTVEYVVTVGDSLAAELIVTNKSDGEFVFENCLHTYFTVGDINTISVEGLSGADYLDHLAGFARKTEIGDAIRFDREVDRIYLDAPHTVIIRDPSLRRSVRIEKSGSASTVVWNPWIAKAKAMPDFGDDEYKQMVCVESGNVAANKIKLPPGESSTLKVTLSSEPL
jgi:glucose-6-phosphate 1-epimerase